MAAGFRAEHGKYLMTYVSERLTQEFGKGFDKCNLHYMKQFHLAFPMVSARCSPLSWSHYRLLVRVEEEKKRMFARMSLNGPSWTGSGSFSWNSVRASRSSRAPQRIATETENYHVDLVFCNGIPKCSVPIDLKAGMISPQDIDQMDFHLPIEEEIA